MAPITVGSHSLQKQDDNISIHIGDDIWIGGNVTMDAGAVITKDIPDNTLVAGVPAKKIRDLENDV